MRSTMKMQKGLGLVAVLALATVACEQHSAPRPGGTGFYAEPPTGVVSALPEHVAEKARVLAERCEEGDFNACARLGHGYVVGMAPVVKSSGHGGGDHEGEEGHGHGHYGGHPEVPLPVDLNRALGLFEASCAVGFQTSCMAAASLLMEGEGVTRDATRAAALVATACRDFQYIDACLANAAMTTRSDERARILASTCYLLSPEACRAAAPQRF